MDNALLKGEIALQLYDEALDLLYSLDPEYDWKIEVEMWDCSVTTDADPLSYSAILIARLFDISSKKLHADMVVKQFKRAKELAVQCAADAEANLMAALKEAAHIDRNGL